MQELQGEAGCSSGSRKYWDGTSRFVENRDPSCVFAVWQRDHGTVQANPGTSCALPGMFPAEAACGFRMI
jgi:hypothetical protein